VKVQVDIDAQKILRRLGMGGSDKVRKFLASEVVRLSDPYVPFQQGMLKNQKTIASDGSQIVYTQPYAHYQWEGLAMSGVPPKHYNGNVLHYHGAPMRGKRWTERMWADKRNEIENNVEKYIG
jgi:hypothetical protein